MSHVEAIQSNYRILLRCTTINFYVTDSLRAEDIIDDEQESDLRAERSHLRQRILLFQWLKEVSSDRYESFLKVMKDTEQEYVANLLRGSTDEKHLPLSNARYERLEKIRPKLAKVTRTDTEVLAGLRRLDAISDTDDDEIRAEKVEYVKSSKLISAIMRRCNHSYNSFQEVLKETLQERAAEYLNEGEMPAVHLKNNRPDLDGPLSLALNGVINNQKSDDAEIKEQLANLNGLGLNLVKAVPGQSIIIFVYCKTIDDAITFTQHFNSGRLQYILGRILNRLLLTIEPHGTKNLDSRISLEDDDIISLEEFTGLESVVKKNSYRPNPSYKHRGRDAAAQTDEQEILKTSTEKQKKSLGAKEKLKQALKENEQEKLRLLAELRYKSEPVLVQNIDTNFERNKKQWFKTESKDIRGMAILAKELFIVSDKSSEVEVYESVDFSLKRRWNLSELIDPKDIASCERNKCLYINHSKGFANSSSEILRVDPTGKLTKKWSDKDDWGHGLSVTDESNVILTVHRKYRLNEYSPDGELIRSIHLSSDICSRYLLHAIKLINGDFVISRHPFYGDDSQRVYLVDAVGNLKKSFGEKRGSLIEQMKDPVHLSVDANGFVMVADRGNGRILLLDSNLELKGEILSKDGKQRLRCPDRILLDEINSRLFVADNESRNQRILIFEFK